MESNQKIPGEKIAQIEEYLPGDNTYEDNDVIIDNTSNLPRIYSSGNATPDNANGYSAGQAHCNSINIQSGAKVTVESPSFGTAKLNVNH